SYTSYDTKVGGSIILHSREASPHASPSEFFVEPKKAFTITYQEQHITLLGFGYQNGSCIKKPPKSYSSAQCVSRCFAPRFPATSGCQLAGAGFNSSARACSVLDNLDCLAFPEYCNADGAPGVCQTMANASLLPQCTCGSAVNDLPQSVVDAYYAPCQDVTL